MLNMRIIFISLNFMAMETDSFDNSSKWLIFFILSKSISDRHGSLWLNKHDFTSLGQTNFF